MIVVYSFVVMDLPHWGHVLHLKKAKELGDVLIVGVLDSDTVESYKRKPIMELDERTKIVSRIKGVDLVILQFEKFPLETLKNLHKLFPNDKLVCVHGDDWKKVEFEEVVKYLKTIGGELKLLPYYSGESTTKIINKVRRGES